MLQGIFFNFYLRRVVVTVLCDWVWMKYVKPKEYQRWGMTIL